MSTPKSRDRITTSVSSSSRKDMPSISPTATDTNTPTRRNPVRTTRSSGVSEDSTASALRATPISASARLRKPVSTVVSPDLKREVSDLDLNAVAEQAKQLGRDAKEEMESLSRKSQWIVLAVLSGTCAAFNGVFAKLTTTDLTSTFALSIARLFGFKDGSTVIEALVRAMFFGLNLIFNGIMWTLFTKALARGTSTTQVTILNTSSNFLFTAILGLIIFSESLPPQWFGGAALLVIGNVIIGRREEKDADEVPELGIDGEGEGLVAAGRAENARVGETGEGWYSDEFELDDEAKAHEERERADLIDLGKDGDSANDTSRSGTSSST